MTDDTAHLKVEVIRVLQKEGGKVTMAKLLWEMRFEYHLPTLNGVLVSLEADGWIETNYNHHGDMFIEINDE